MSMRFRKEGRGRGRSVSMAAAVTVVTTMAWLVATAIPASALSTCASATVTVANDKVVLTIGADDDIVMDAVAGVWNFSINGGAMAVCAATATVAAVDWIEVTGSNAGAETFTAYDPATDWGAINTTINLGNGTDGVIFQYAAMTAPVLPDTGVGATFGLGTAAGGSINGGSPVAGTSDFRIDNGENIVVNGSNGLAVIDLVSMSDLLQVGASTIAATTADDTFATVAPVLQNVTFNAGSGDDTFVSGDGADNFQGGPGADTVSYASASAGVTADLAAATGTGQGSDILADVQNATGSAFADILTGNTLDNVLIGGDGADTLDGAAGNDTLTGGLGSDTLVGGASTNGSDVITGGAGALDWLDYTGRTNSLYVAPGGGLVSGEGGCPLGAGCEMDSVGADIELFTLGGGADTFVGSGTAESVQGGAGDDNIDGNGGFDYLDSSDAAGPANFNMITGLATGNGTDTFSDVEGFIGTAAGDTVVSDDVSGIPLDFIGLGGTDTVDASASVLGVVIDLTFGILPPPHDVENAIGGAGDDTLMGNILGNKLTGNNGVDIIDGFGGNDKIEGGLGNDLLDTLAGNTGADTLVYSHADSGEDIDNQLGFATGGDGQDSIGFFAIIRGSDFDDRIRAGQTAFSGNQRLYGRGGDDSIVGSNSSDLLYGGGGDDHIRAGGGDDDLLGAAGDDVLVGGRGFDLGRGGNGDDRCKQIEDKHSC